MESRLEEVEKGNDMELAGKKKGRNEIDAMYEYEELYNTTHDISKIDSVVRIKRA